jgi:hypothetical protein
VRETAGEQVSGLINDEQLETYINMELESVERTEKSEKQKTQHVLAIADQNNQ